MKRFTVSAGRQIDYKGQPFISINKEGKTPPVEADEITHIIAEALEERVLGTQQDARDLEEYAKPKGLNWKISYKSERGEPRAFHLISDSGKTVYPSQVIGETIDQAIDTIDLASHSSRIGKRRR